jgi:hypothetical protein
MFTLAPQRICRTDCRNFPDSDECTGAQTGALYRLLSVLRNLIPTETVGARAARCAGKEYHYHRRRSQFLNGLVFSQLFETWGELHL